MGSWLFFVASVGLVFLLLVFSEFYWRRHKVHGELSRKFVHITVGTFVAVWPFFLTWRQILFLSAAFLVVIIISKYYKIFQAIHSVTRPTWGEIYFAIAVGATSLITHNKFLFAAALLHMSLADGLAAIVGNRYGRNNSYLVSGHVKSLAGTAAFIVVSVAILGVYGIAATSTLQPLVILSIALAAAAIENVGIYGLDNLFVPLLVGVALKLY